MSMFQEFFELSGEGPKLFEGLEISKYEDIMEHHCSKYPVISLSFKGAKQIDFSSSSLSLRREISYEYDVPLENAYFEGFYEEMMNFVCSLLESALKTNNNLQFGILSGCLRISHESIFTALNFLFFTGYLTKNHTKNYDSGDRFFSLEIPNKEVAYIFRNKIMNWFNDTINQGDWNGFYNAIFVKDTSFIEEVLNNILINSISHEDYHENYYHGFMVGLLSSMKMQDYIIESNRETGKSRSDIIVRHVNPTGKAVIFELKCTSNRHAMEKLVEDALNQIEEKQYDRALLQSGFEKVNIIKYGISFCKKLCLVKTV